jgi:hypothetical protein
MTEGYPGYTTGVRGKPIVDKKNISNEVHTLYRKDQRS